MPTRTLPALLLSIPLLSAVGLSAQASVTYYGQPCPTAAAPPLRIIGLPRLGTTFWIETISGAGLSDGGSRIEIMFGLSNTMLGQLALPYDISPFTTSLLNVYCGWLLQSWDASIPVTSVRGIPQTVQLPITVPNDPSLIGTNVYVQVARHTSTSFIRSSSHNLSRGAHLVIGP